MMRFLQLLIRFLTLGWLFKWINTVFRRMKGGIVWLFSRLKQCWQRCWQSQYPFYKNLIIGSLFALLFVGLYDSQWVTNIEDLQVDWMMGLYEGKAPKKDAPPFVVLDIDEKTYRLWGEPALTPRDKILKLLTLAVKAHPKLIIVDIIINTPQETDDDKMHLDDQALFDFLNNYEKTHCQSDCPHIILARALRLPPGIEPFTANNKPWEQASGFLEDAVAKSPHLHWAAILFDRETDQVLRRWQLWTPTCTEGIADIVPSISLLSTTLLADPKQGATRLKQQLAYLKPSHCSNEVEKQPIADISRHQTFKVNDTLTLDLQPSRLSRRILYTISEQGYIPNFPNDKLLLMRFSAADILTDNDAPLRDRITVIGGSFLDSRDWYATPLGWMPGMYIHINSIHSLQQYGILKHPNIWVVLAIAILLIVLTSALLATLHSFWAMLISIGIIIIILMPISFWLFQYGVWLSFAIPIVAIQLRQIAEGFGKPLKSEA